MSLTTRKSHVDYILHMPKACLVNYGFFLQTKPHNLKVYLLKAFKKQTAKRTTSKRIKWKSYIINCTAARAVRKMSNRNPTTVPRPTTYDDSRDRLNNIGCYRFSIPFSTPLTRVMRVRDSSGSALRLKQELKVTQVYKNSKLKNK